MPRPETVFYQHRAGSQAANLHIVRFSYWNSALFSPAAMVRILQRTLARPNRLAQTTADRQMLPNFLNGTLLTLLRTENRFFRRYRLPIGSSALLVAAKQ